MRGAIAAALVLLTVGASDGQGYLRTRVESSRANDPNARCLYWIQGPITWTQSTPGTADLPDGESFAAIRRSFERWQAVMEGCGNISLVEGQPTESRKIGYDPESADNLNLVIFRDTDCNDVVSRTDFCWSQETCGNRHNCWFYDDSVLALTTSTYDLKSGEVYDSDIELNAADHTFTVSDTSCTRVSDQECVCPPGVPCAQTDIENTMTHEVGHVVGLAHVTLPSSTMFATAPVGETQKREVDPASAEFICDAYPKGSPPKNCVLQPASDELGFAPSGCGGSPLFGAAFVALHLRRRRRSL